MAEVRISERAEDAIGTLPSQDQERIRRAIARLSDGSSSRGIPQSYRVRGPGGDSLYVIRASDRFRVLYRVVDAHTIDVVGVVNHDLVREYFQSAVG